MRGIWLEEGKLRLCGDLSVPDPPEGEGLVRLLRAGICNTDLELVKGYYPFTGVPGHEFVGVVERGPKGMEGQRVVGEINAVCNLCRDCREGRRSHCRQRTVLGIVGRNGAFAEYLTLPLENLHPVPENVSTDAATFAEPLAAALEIQQQVRVAPDDRVLVVGDGKLGLLIGQTLALTGCQLLVVGRYADKLAHLDRRGIDTGTAEKVEPGSFDLAVECTGNEDGFDLARRGLRPRGRMVLKSTYAGSLSIDVSSLVVDEISLIGSRCGPLAPALRLLAAGRIDVESLIGARYSLDEGLDGFTRAGEKGMLKVLLKMDEG
jgi:threonine dehydrogenase-like Zn-dependent dehydrogenase